MELTRAPFAEGWIKVWGIRAGAWANCGGAGKGFSPRQARGVPRRVDDGIGGDVPGPVEVPLASMATPEERRRSLEELYYWQATRSAQKELVAIDLAQTKSLVVAAFMSSVGLFTLSGQHVGTFGEPRPLWDLSNKSTWRSLWPLNGWSPNLAWRQHRAMSVVAGHAASEVLMATAQSASLNHAPATEETAAAVRTAFEAATGAVRDHLRQSLAPPPAPRASLRTWSRDDRWHHLECNETRMARLFAAWGKDGVSAPRHEADLGRWAHTVDRSGR